MSKGKTLKPKELIFSTLKDKSRICKNVFDNAESSFALLKEVTEEFSEELQDVFKQDGNGVDIVYRDRGMTEAEFSFGSDMLIFNLQPDIFLFDRDHSIWNTSYVQDNDLNAFVGIISIYNFLTDSFKFNRPDDLGYMIARIYINAENHYFVEGKRQLGFLYNDFGNEVISKEILKKILESAVLYCLDFDLLVPNYDDVSIVTVDQMKDKISKSKSQTGKRLGFKFYPDDDNIK
jgi:hypothetical protein